MSETGAQGVGRAPRWVLLCTLAALPALTIVAAAVFSATAAPPSAVVATAHPMAEDEPAAASVPRQPHHAVRTLGALQERVAHGDEAALSLQKSLVHDIAHELKAFPPDAWQSARNRQALIKFALSGGDPEMLRLVLARKLFTPPELPLAQATLAYAEGQRSVALRLLDKIDINELPPTLAGHVALVKAIVIANTDLAQVIRLADDARLSSPGTLIEETALRLAIEAAISLGNRAKFEAAALRYFRRFPRSPYLVAVIRPVAAAVADGGYSERSDGVRWVHGVVQYLDPNRLVQFYSALADAGLRSARLETAINASRMAQKYVRSGSAEEAWALAYEGAALVVGKEGVQGLDRLDAAEALGVSGPVGDLIAGARAMAKLIQTPPIPPPALGVASAESDAPPPQAASTTDPPSSAPAPAGRHPAASKALARIAQVDKMLKEIEE